MSKTRNLSDLLDANGDVKSTALDNVPASDVVNDTTPQLGGNLDAQTYNITDTGEVYVGKSTDAFATVGVVLSDSQANSFTRDGANVMSVRRNTSDGDLVSYYKDATKVGSIGSFSSLPYVAGSSDGILIGSGNVVPSTNTGAISNNTMDLGSSNRQFKDGYFGGTVNAGGVSLGDSDVLNLGASNDLQISHDGNNSLIADTGTGDLFIRGSNNIYLQNAGGTTMSRLASGAGNYLYYNGSQKFETTSTGATVTGDLNVTGSISGAGKVGQVVFNHTSTRTTYTQPASGVTDIAALNTSITPTSTSSRVLIQIQISCEAHHDGVFRLFRGTTEIGRNSNSTSRWSGFAFIDYDPDYASTANTFFFQYVDSPSTTSSTQYKLAIGKAANNDEVLYLNRTKNSTGGDTQEIATSSMTLTEILP